MESVVIYLVLWLAIYGAWRCGVRMLPFCAVLIILWSIWQSSFDSWQAMHAMEHARATSWFGLWMTWLLLWLVLFGLQVSLILGAAISFWTIFHALSIAVTHRRLRVGAAILSPVARDQYLKQFKAFQSAEAWAQSRELEPVGSFRLRLLLGKMLLVSWRDVPTSSYLCAYVNSGKLTCEFGTDFSAEVGLCTSDSIEGFSLRRRPGSYLQVYPKLGLDELWEKHINAVRYLETEAALRIEPPRLAFEQAVLRDVCEHLAYVRSLRGWVLRLPYWALVTTRKMRNVSLQQQHQRRYSSLPIARPVKSASTLAH